MYVHFTNAVRTLLIPVAQPTVRAQRLQDLGLFPSSQAHPDPAMTPLHVRTSYKYCVCFADVYGPINSPCAPSISS
jgi:hypothetical protein